MKTHLLCPQGVWYVPFNGHKIEARRETVSVPQRRRLLGERGKFEAFVK